MAPVQTRYYPGTAPVQPWYSPGMNTIENCWSEMKWALTKEKQTTINGIKVIVQRIWDKISPQYLSKLFASMPRRIRAVIDANGGPTKY